MEDAHRASKKEGLHQSAAWVLTVLIGSVFITEALVMILMPMLPRLTEVAAMALDATLLCALISPIFYFLVYRPLTRNIAELKAAQLRLQLAASVFSHAREGIMITETDGTIVEVNDTFSRITGYGRQEAVGRTPRILKSGRQTMEHYQSMWRAIIEKGYWDGEIWNRRKNGEVYAEMLTVSAVSDDSGMVRHFVALFSDITPLKEHQDQLERIAHFDALTNLPNRVLLADRLGQAILQSQRRKKSLAVAYLDLDGFKAVNDIHGHGVGDELLIAVSHRMKEVLREGDTLSRIGGDEFVVLLVDLDGPQDIEPVLARLLQAAADPVTLGEAMVMVSASIGVTIYPRDNADSDTLLRHADQAMYQAKQAGRNRYQMFGIAEAGDDK